MNSSFFAVLVLASIIWTKEAKKPERKCTRKNYSRQALVSTVPHSKADAVYLKTLEKKLLVDLWTDPVRDREVLLQVHRNLIKCLQKALRQRNMKLTERISNLERSVRRERMASGIGRLPMALDPKNFDFFRYHRIQEIENYIKYITRTHPNRSRLLNIGSSFEKRPLLAVEISSAPSWENEKTVMEQNEEISASSKRQSSRKLILMDCGIHAREWASVAFCLYAINQLIQGTDSTMKEVLDKYDFIIIPVLNPDGYVYSMTTDRFWRKTRSTNSAIPGCVGVDANRNFDVGNGKCEDKDPCSAIYCGDRPFSEPETASLDRLLKVNSKRLLAYFAVHTFGQLWLLPWCKTHKKPDNYEDMETVAKIGAKAIKNVHGTEYQVGMASNVLYICLGTATDYVYERKYATYTYALELRDKGQVGFMLPVEQLLPMCEETMAGVAAAVLALH